MTIEERAKEYEENYPHMDDFYYSYYVSDGYIQGATEQKQIDIDKAVRWLETQNLTRGRYDFIEAFKKAMEE